MLLAPSGIGVDMTKHHLPAVNHIDQLVREDAMAINLRARWDYKKRKKKKSSFRKCWKGVVHFCLFAFFAVLGAFSVTTHY